MANDSFTQQALAQSETFKRRVRNAYAKVAWQILEENVNTVNHVNRVAYAQKVINNIESMTNSIMSWIVTRTNVMGFATSYDFAAQSVISASGDPDIESQLSSDWNILSGS